MATHPLSRFLFAVVPLLALLACETSGDPTASNTPPTAIAGPDMSANVGEVVHLVGTASHDSESANLTYSWSFVSMPAASRANISGASSVSATFTPDAAGQYTIRLTVSDGQASATDDCVVMVNAPPIANAGPDQTVNVGAQVQLNGSGSSDQESANLTYSWSFVSRPTGSSTSLSGTTTVAATFTPDVRGQYTIRLTVSDGESSATDDCVVTVNAPPTANAGPDQAVNVGALVQLNGSGSSDPENANLSYSWSFTSRPAGSIAALTNPASVSPTFSPDVVGAFVVALTVSDGMATSASDDVIITAAPPPPTPGHYSGITSQGHPISFAVAQSLNSLMPGLKYKFTTCFGTSEITHTVSRALVDGRFSWSGTSSAVVGWSTSATTFSGTARYIDTNYGCPTVDVTWTATWSGPAPAWAEIPLGPEVIVDVWRRGVIKKEK